MYLFFWKKGNSRRNNNKTSWWPNLLFCSSLLFAQGVSPFGEIALRFLIFSFAERKNKSKKKLSLYVVWAPNQIRQISLHIEWKLNVLIKKCVTWYTFNRSTPLFKHQLSRTTYSAKNTFWVKMWMLKLKALNYIGFKFQKIRMQV